MFPAALSYNTGNTCPHISITLYVTIKHTITCFLQPSPIIHTINMFPAALSYITGNACPHIHILTCPDKACQLICYVHLISPNIFLSQ